MTDSQTLGSETPDRVVFRRLDVAVRSNPAFCLAEFETLKHGIERISYGSSCPDLVE